MKGTEGDFADGQLCTNVEFMGSYDGGPDRNRTCDTWFRKPLLYPLSYGASLDGKAFGSSIPDDDGATQTGASGCPFTCDGVWYTEA